MDFTREGLERAGFLGFRTISELSATRCASAPESPGVYIVLRESAAQPSFLPVGTGGRFKRKDPNVPIEELQRKWVAGAAVVYIGMTTATLRKRVGDYMRFGNGGAVGHYGGRYIWQLADAQRLLVCWKVTTGDHAEGVERDLLDEFRLQHDHQVPFANLR